MRCAIVCHCGVDPGRVGVVMRRWAVGIGQVRVVSDALRRCDLGGAGRVGWGTFSVWRIWCRRALRICGVSPCYGDWWVACRVGCAGRRSVASCHVKSYHVMSCYVVSCYVA